MGSAFHQLCPRYSGTLTPTAPTAIRLWDTFTFTYYTWDAALPTQYFIKSVSLGCWAGNYLKSIPEMQFYLPNISQCQSCKAVGQ